MSKHKNNCECVICNGMSFEELARLEKENLGKHGFCIHYVMEDPMTPYGLNAHTHGLMTTFSHLDLQIVLPISQHAVSGILYSAVAKIKEGKQFEPGERVYGIIKNFAVRFIEATEGDRPVLRIILPDQEGHLETYDLDENFALQYCGIGGADEHKMHAGLR